MLMLTNVKKSYNTIPVLQIPHLQIENGINWLKGANGSGKTTLLKLIAGLIPFEGDVSFNDISLKLKPVLYRQNVSWAEAEPLYPPFITGINLLSLYRSIRKAPKNEMDKLIELFNMNGYVNNTIETYSTGMTKQLSLALAFMGNQQLIVLDEPLITLDPDALTSVCTFILEKHKGTTFLMSSHQELDSRLMFYCREITINNQTIVTG